MEKVGTFVAGDEIIEIWQFGIDDYAVYYVTSGCSVRGTLLEVMRDLHKTYRVFDE